MKVFRPVLSNTKSQSFGQNLACAKVHTNGSLIFPYAIINKKGGVCPVGSVDFYTTALGMKGHNGEDWAAFHGEKVYFPVMAETEWYARGEVDSSGGIGIDVLSKVPIEIDVLPPQTGPTAKTMWEQLGGKSYVMFRFHHAMLNVPADGSEVKAGFLIQKADSTGASGGDHCHWSMKFCDGQGNTLDTDNGYSGAVDFSRWFTNAFILDEMTALVKKENEGVTITPEEQATTTTQLLPHYMPTNFDRIVALINTLLSIFRRR